MATNQPAHGSSAQVVDFVVFLAAHGLDRAGLPNRVRVELSTDANNTFQIEANPIGEFPCWRLDARVSRGSIEVLSAFCDGQGVYENDVPDWMGVIVEESRSKLLEGSA